MVKSAVMTSAEVEEIKRHFGVVAEGPEKRIQVVAEAVTQFDSKVDRDLAGLREEMRAGFAEVKSMIKFSYAELDRRISFLEAGLATVEARIRSLESR